MHDLSMALERRINANPVHPACLGFERLVALRKNDAERFDRLAERFANGYLETRESLSSFGDLLASVADAARKH